MSLTSRGRGAGSPADVTDGEPSRLRPPQCIAHRGYSAKYPENTIAAFQGAADAGADALETDLHLSRDGVVVLSHVCPSTLPPHPNPMRGSRGTTEEQVLTNADVGRKP